MPPEETPTQPPQQPEPQIITPPVPQPTGSPAPVQPPAPTNVEAQPQVITPTETPSVNVPSPPQPTEQQPTVNPSPVVPGPQVYTSPAAAATGGWQPPTAGKSNKKLLGVVAAVIAVVVLGCAAFALFGMRQQPPDDVFKSMLDNVYSTKLVSQHYTAPSTTFDFKYDVTDITKPIVSSSTSLDLYGSSIKTEGYGNAQNSYSKYVSLGNTGGQYAQYVGKWVQTRKDGKTIGSTNGVDIVSSDTLEYLLGNIMFGNFSAAQRSDLTNYTLTNHVYKYDASKVKTDTLDGNKVMIFDVTQDAAASKKLNAKVGKLFGLTQQMISDAVDTNGVGGKYKLIVDTKSDRLVQVKGSDSGVNYTNTYSYDHVSLPAEPKADLTTDQFLKGLSSADQPGPQI